MRANIAARVNLVPEALVKATTNEGLGEERERISCQAVALLSAMTPFSC